MAGGWFDLGLFGGRRARAWPRYGVRWRCRRRKSAGVRDAPPTADDAAAVAAVPFLYFAMKATGGLGMGGCRRRHTRGPCHATDNAAFVSGVASWRGTGSDGRLQCSRPHTPLRREPPRPRCGRGVRVRGRVPKSSRVEQDEQNEQNGRTGRGHTLARGCVAIWKLYYIIQGRMCVRGGWVGCAASRHACVSVHDERDACGVGCAGGGVRGSEARRRDALLRLLAGRVHGRGEHLCGRRGSG